ncbi:hypothetical protein GW888_00070 [Candidatus Wolfebacteria bacterium]|nr:hypothetical protein [Candidatus Wolfebacteria bacterium]
MKKPVLTILITIVLIVVILEVLSKSQKCKTPDCFYPCNNFSTILPGPRDPDLIRLQQKRLAGEKISKQEYRLIAEKLILEKDPELMGCYNGVVCGESGFVRKDLPSNAKIFVKRHELEHLLQTGEERNSEFAANLAAGREYPLGFLQTIFFSIWNRARYYDSPVCYIISLWKTFKVYFLP